MILTNDSALAEDVYRLKNHGRLEKGVFVHERIGFNFSFTEMQAALGRSQLRKLDRIIADRARIRECYAARLAGIPGVRLQAPPPRVSPVYWFTNVLVDDAASLSHVLAEARIQSRRFFYPLHCQPCFAALQEDQTEAGTFVHSSAAFQQGLSLPSSHGLSEDTIDRVRDRIERWSAEHGKVHRSLAPLLGSRIQDSGITGQRRPQRATSEFTI